MRSSAVAVAVGLLTAACERQPPIQISRTPAGAYEASLARIDGGFIAAWYDTRDGHGEIYVRRLDTEGHPVAVERRLTTGVADAYEADVATLAGGFVVGWYEKTKDGHLTPKIGAWKVDGTARWITALSAQGRNTVVRSLGDVIFAAWIEDEDHDRSGVWATWRRGDGVTLVAPRRIADAGRTTWNLNAAIDPDATLDNPHAWVAFDAKAGTTAEELFLVEVAGLKDRVVQLTPNDGQASKYPDIGFSESRAAVTWFDVKDGNEEVYLAIDSKDAVAQGRLSPVRITRTAGESIGAYLAWNGDRLGLAWCDDTPGNQELYFQSFDRDGRALGEATRLTTTDSASSIPAIKAWRSGFALLWNEYTPTSAPAHHGDVKSQIVFRVVE